MMHSTTLFFVLGFLAHYLLSNRKRFVLYWKIVHKLWSMRYDTSMGRELTLTEFCGLVAKISDEIGKRKNQFTRITKRIVLSEKLNFQTKIDLIDVVKWRMETVEVRITLEENGGIEGGVNQL